MIRVSHRHTLFAAVLVSCTLTTVASASTLTVPAPYTTIQAAVKAASPGDTIQVAAGTYTESVIITISLTINGAGAGTIVTGPAPMVGASQGGAFIVNTSGVTVTISNLTVQNSLA